MTLGLEFLLRAPLAKLNPVLLADPTAGDGYSVLHAAGVAPPRNREPVSVGLKTVLERLVAVVPGFTTEDQESARFLTNVRNQELHSSDMSTSAISAATWMPRFLRLVGKLSAYFSEDVADYFSQDFIKHASHFVDSEDKQLKNAIEQRMSKARVLYAGLRPEEREARKPTLFTGSDGLWPRPTECKACGEIGLMLGEAVRTGRETLDEDMVTKRIYFVASRFACSVCGFTLSGTNEMAVIDVIQEWTQDEVESLVDRFAQFDFEPDYGND